MSPLVIGILLHHHVSNERYKGNGYQSLIWRDTMLGLVSDGLLVSVGDEDFLPTERLHAYCEALCRVPLPTQQWVVPGYPEFGALLPRTPASK
jgi:hypothetical protein